MLDQLADADGVGLAALGRSLGGFFGGGFGRFGGFCGLGGRGVGLAGGAGGQAQDHDERQKQC